MKVRKINGIKYRIKLNYKNLTDNWLGDFGDGEIELKRSFYGILIRSDLDNLFLLKC